MEWIVSCRFLARGISLLSGLLLVGCATNGFTRTDPNFIESRREMPPEFFLDRLPSRPYRRVGRVVVSLPADAPLSEVRAALAEKGQSVGCEVLIEPSLDQKTSMLFGRWTPSSARLTHDGPHGGASQEFPSARGAPDRSYEFVCGVFENSAT